MNNEQVKFLEVWIKYLRNKKGLNSDQIAILLLDVINPHDDTDFFKMYLLRARDLLKQKRRIK